MELGFFDSAGVTEKVYAEHPLPVCSFCYKMLLLKVRWVVGGGGNVTPGLEGRKYVLVFKNKLRDVRPLFVFLAFAVFAALAILLSMVPATQAQTAACPKIDSLQVPGAQKQEEFCLPDLTTEGLVQNVHTDRNDWLVTPLHAEGTINPPEPVPGIQINGCFPDD